MEALKSGVSKVDDGIESSTRGLLGSALTRVFSNLHRRDPPFDLLRVIEPLPADLRDPLWDEVR